MFSAIFSIVLGVIMFAQWAFFLLTGGVPEVKTEPARVWLHIAAEWITAVLLVISGIGLLSNVPWSVPLAFLAHGMLIYTVIQSPGYFAHKKVWPLVGMFAVFLILALISAGALFNSVLAAA